MLQDSYKLKGKRKQLAEEIKNQGIRSEKVIKAIAHLPRHFFFPNDFVDKAYENIAFPIEGGQTISQPYTVAFQTELLDIKKGDKVLEVGTGSGYQAAVLKVLGAEVHSIETVRELHEETKTLFAKLGLDIFTYLGDGSKGLPELAPFDKIIITAAAPSISKPLAEQLKIGGRLVAPVGDKSVQKMILVKRDGENEFKQSTHGQFTFVPLTGTYGWQ
ncbi:protein-L-isoaspartate(D-aspartate) O-methyltransferase [bacterium]|nr:protein-L-isoaspartate(D-aspartate) O-methyltransferase [bacterium]